MEREENKLFKFATKELSQDAFISWCINWFNYQEQVKGNKNKEKLCEMSKKILDKLLNHQNITSEKIKNVSIIRQFENIDILVVVTLKNPEQENSEQYLIIIEDKVGANLNGQQQDTLYVKKLTKALENNKEKQNLISLTNFDENKIIPVFWKTGIWNEEKEQLKKKLENKIKKEVICIDGNDTLQMLKDYIKYSEIVEDFYIYLEEFLRVNNQLPQDEYCVDKIIENEKIIEGTTFTKNYYAYNCFLNLIGRDKKYKGKSHPRRGGLGLNKINKRIIDENILKSSNKFEKGNNTGKVVAVDAIRFFTFGENYENRLSENSKKWTEIVNKQKVDEKEFYSDLRYVFLFAKRINPFRKEQYQFLGLYKFNGYDKKKYSREWKKCILSNNEVPLNEDKIIEIIKKIEKE